MLIAYIFVQKGTQHLPSPAAWRYLKHVRIPGTEIVRLSYRHLHPHALPGNVAVNCKQLCDHRDGLLQPVWPGLEMQELQAPRHAVPSTQQRHAHQHVAF